jgi:hypothetical protein
LKHFQAGLSLFSAETCLATALASYLAEMDRKDHGKTQIILPTARLANRISAMVCQRIGAWQEPLFLTFESFVHHHLENLPGAAQVLPGTSDMHVTLLLGSLIRSRTYKHINESHIGELKQLFNEFEDWRFKEEGFERLRNVLSENTFRSDEAIANLFERVNEAEDLYSQFKDRLLAVGKIPARQRQIELADTLTAAINQGYSPKTDRIIMAGITSVMPWSHELLKAVASKWPLQVWAPEPSDSEKDPVRVLISILGLAENDWHRLESITDELAAKHLAIHHASEVLAEAGEAINIANSAIKQGIKPAEIGILVTSDHEYGRPLRALLKNHSDIAYNAAITKAFSTCLTGSWLATLRQVSHRGEDAASLSSFLTHPVTLASIAISLPSRNRTMHANLREDLLRDLCAGGVESGLLATSAGFERRSPMLATALKSLNTTLHDFLRPNYETTLHAWRDHFVQLLSTFAPADHEDPSSPGLKASVEAALEGFILELSESVIEGELLDSKAFLDIVAEHLLAGDIRDTGDQLRGLQILSVEEARFVPFQLLIIVGCNEGSFPRSLPKDYLFDNYLKTKIGLPGWQAVEAIEDSTFHLIKARTTNLHLLYTENPADGLKIRSRYIDEIKHKESPRLITVSTAEVMAPYIRSSETEGVGFSLTTTDDRIARVATAGAFNGDRSMLLNKLSATSLEALIKCPYRFLLRQLGVRELEIPEEDDLRKEGDWLHGVLEAFFTGYRGQERLAEPLSTKLNAEEFYLYALERLNLLTTLACPPHLAGTETWVQVKTIGWPAFAAHIEKLYRIGGIGRIEDGRRELNYKTQVPLTLESGTSQRFAPVLDGKIDSIDVPLPGVHIITDYKRNHTPDKAAVLSGRAPQLTLYAAALEQMGAQHKLATNELFDAFGEVPLQSADLKQSLIGYWSILSGAFVAIAAGSEVREDVDRLGLMSLKTKGDLEEVFQNLQTLIGNRRTELLEAKRILPDPKDCTFCKYAGICRKDDPEFIFYKNSLGQLGPVGVHCE